MTLSSTTNRISYNCEPPQKEFPFNFKIFGEENLLVVLKDENDAEAILVLNTDYSVNTGPWPNGGTLTTLGEDPYESGNTLTIIRQLPFTQGADYIEGDPFPAETHEEGLDRVVMLLQALEERVLKLKTGSSYSDLLVPNPIAGRYLRWKDDLSGLENCVFLPNDINISNYMETLLDDETAIAAHNTLGLGSVAMQDAGSVNIAGIIITASGSCINGEYLVDLSILADKIADLTITSTKIANATITAQQIADLAITAQQIANATITGAKIGNGEITGGLIADQTITTGKIGSLQITAAVIDNLTITAGKIANNTITGGKVAAATLDKTHLTFTAFDLDSDDLDNIPDGDGYAKILKTDIQAGHIKLSECIGSLDNIDNGASYGKVLITDIQAGHIKLSECIGSLDNIVNGATYGRVLLTDISAGHIKLSEVLEDATHKIFLNTEQTKLGGVESGADVTSAHTCDDPWSGHDLDDLGNGTTYGKVLLTDISAGHIKLSECVGDLDDIANGTYGKVLTTAISAGKIILSGAGVTGVLSVSYTSAKCTDPNADETLANPQNLNWLNGAVGTLTLSSSGKLRINAADALEIQAGGNIKVLAGGDIRMQTALNDPSLIRWINANCEVHLGYRHDQDHYCLYPFAANQVIYKIGADTKGASLPFYSMYIDVAQTFYLTATDIYLHGKINKVGADNVCLIKTGTYTGDGTGRPAAGQVIAGVGFTPKAVMITMHPTGEHATAQVWKLDESWGAYAIYHSGGTHQFLDWRITVFGADGFTVNDDGADSHPNANGYVYDFICWA